MYIFRKYLILIYELNIYFDFVKKLRSHHTFKKQPWKYIIARGILPTLKELFILNDVNYATAFSQYPPIYFKYFVIYYLYKQQIPYSEQLIQTGLQYLKAVEIKYKNIIKLVNSSNTSMNDIYIIEKLLHFIHQIYIFIIIFMQNMMRIYNKRYCLRI